MFLHSHLLSRFRNHLVRLAAVGLIFSFTNGPANAGLMVAGSGTGTGGHTISGTAEFDFVMHNFGSGNVNAIQITLTNTAETSLRGNLITGLFFNIAGDAGDLSTDSTGFDGRASVYTDANGTTITDFDIAPAVNNSSTDGTWQLSNGPFGIANGTTGSYASFEYGIATVGMGLTGFNGAAVNGDDYGIFSGPISGITSGVNTALPLIKDSARFWILRPGALTSLSQFENVRITYGSQPDNFITAVPEPTSLTLVGIGACVAGFGASRRRRN